MINRVTCGWIAIPCLTHTRLETQTSQTSWVTNFRLCERSSGSKRAWGLRRLTDLWKYLILKISDVTINFLCICLLYTCTHTCIYIYILFSYMIFLPTNPQNIIGIQWAPQQRWRYPHHFSSHQLDKLDWLNPDWSRGVTFRFNPFNWRSPLHPCFPNPVQQ
jgi:hypothetical protein